MAKLYVFGIGGTGARVIKSLTMLLASGVKLADKNTVIIPILIDPDTNNKDAVQTNLLLQKYQNINSKISNPRNFFHHKVISLNQAANETIESSNQTFKFNVEEDNSKFKDFIKYAQLDPTQKQFIDLLFSKNNLDLSLNVGFKGNPNLGSIVLNQITNSNQFQQFINTYQQGDKVFIISSIFGGTGAAGFPLLLKTIREYNPGNIDHPINNVPIGGISYLPYFNLNKNDEEIKSHAFLDKAKVALNYYKRTIIENKQIQSLYFIGNNFNPPLYEYAEGGKDQNNKANFLELAGASSIIHFTYNHNENDVVYNYATTGNENMNFDALSEFEKKYIESPLKMFELFSLYLSKGLSKALNTSRWTKSNIKLVQKHKKSPLDSDFFKSGEFKDNIQYFTDAFQKWLNEMEANQPSFNPFISNIERSRALEYISGKSPKTKFKNFRLLDIQNCKNIDQKEIIVGGNSIHSLVKLFDYSTESVLKKVKLI